MKLVGILIEGERTTHIPDATGNYSTLCGLDGDDDHPSVDQIPCDPGDKVDCINCVQAWHMCRNIPKSKIAF